MNLCLLAALASAPCLPNLTSLSLSRSGFSSSNGGMNAGSDDANAVSNNVANAGSTGVNVGSADVNAGSSGVNASSSSAAAGGVVNVSSSGLSGSSGTVAVTAEGEGAIDSEKGLSVGGDACVGEAGITESGMLVLVEGLHPSR